MTEGDDIQACQIVREELSGDAPARAEHLRFVLDCLRALPLWPGTKKHWLVLWCDRAGLRLLPEWVTYVLGTDHE